MSRTRNLSLWTASREPRAGEWANQVSDAWPSIRYRDFYDIPRAVVVEWSGILYLLDCTYDTDIDDYEPIYTVHRLPEELRTRIDEISWTGLGHLGQRVGSVKTSDVEFDPTRRRSVNPSVFDRLGPQ